MTTSTVFDVRRSVNCTVHYRRIDTTINFQAINHVFAGRKSATILGANPSRTTADGFSYWMAEPKDVFEFRTGQKYPFRKLQKILDKYKLDSDTCLRTQIPKGIFCGGWVGYFGYELGRYIEKLPAKTMDDLKMPLIRLCFYDRFICYDHTNEICWLIAVQLPDDVEKPDEKLAGLEQLLLDSQNVTVPPPQPASLENIDFSNIRCNMDRDYYVKALEKIKRYIYDGEVYQVNFTRRFECRYPAGPIDLFSWQNYYNPSPYAAYIDAGGFQIVSASPEMFITVADGVISTKPIKGTRPRTKKTPEDTVNFNELLTSEKEQAELNMIIDLERNDIAKICIPGTRKVTQPRTIEPYPTVFHAAATIAGQLRNKINFCDILKATFPGGSITGAPKIRSMEIIEQLEPSARGIYTGSIGFIGLDGTVCLNIAIRTIIIKNQMAYAQTGGGIVADSNTDAEWEETITKARALIAGINSVQRTAYGKSFSK
jgi:para-aminobenzoate synthetase component 1